MQIRRVILRNVRNFVNFDQSFEDQWTGHVPETLLLIGPNGSGKTTLLETIASLWQSFGEMLDDPYKISDLALGPLQEFDKEAHPLTSKKLDNGSVVGQTV